MSDTQVEGLSLPLELQYEVLKYLHWSYKYKMRQVCRNWRRFAEECPNWSSFKPPRNSSIKGYQIHRAFDHIIALAGSRFEDGRLRIPLYSDERTLSEKEPMWEPDESLITAPFLYDPFSHPVRQSIKITISWAGFPPGAFDYISIHKERAITVGNIFEAFLSYYQDENNLKNLEAYRVFESLIYDYYNNEFTIILGYPLM